MKDDFFSVETVRAVEFDQWVVDGIPLSRRSLCAMIKKRILRNTEYPRLFHYDSFGLGDGRSVRVGSESQLARLIDLHLATADAAEFDYFVWDMLGAERQSTASPRLS